jgi:hypothetical protein
MEKMCPQSCSLATAVVLSLFYAAVTCQLIWMPQYSLIYAKLLSKAVNEKMWYKYKPHELELKR